MIRPAYSLFRSISKPTPVVGLPSGVKVSALTSSWEGSGALLANGEYNDWGYNAAGQLGDGSTTNSALPDKVDLAGPVIEVSQGGSGANNGQTIAVLRNGSVWAWRNNSRGQLGVGSLVDSHVPVPVAMPNKATVIKVNSGGYASYAIDSTGRLWAWGDNNSGQLGAGHATLLATRPLDVGILLSQVSPTAQNVAGVGNRS